MKILGIHADPCHLGGQPHKGHVRKISLEPSPLLAYVARARAHKGSKALRILQIVNPTIKRGELR